MDRFTTKEGISISYEDDYFGEPWREPETVLLLHGTAESSQVWYAWMPPLCGRYRVIRPDMPGFGRSRIPADMPYSWAARRWASDMKQLVDHLGIASLHVVGAKYGGSTAVEFASAYPASVKTLTVIMGPMQVRSGQGSLDVQGFAARIDENIRRWVEETMGARLGSSVPEEQRRWWIELMAASDPRAARESAIGTVQLELVDRIRAVQVPTLFITTDGNKLVGLDAFREWVERIPSITLRIIHGDSYHPAASHADECIAAALAHIESHPS